MMTVDELFWDSEEAVSHAVSGMHVEQPPVHTRAAIPDDLAEAIQYLARVAEHYRDSQTGAGDSR